MSKQFQGFTPQQQFTLLQRTGYTGSGDQDDMDKFLAATPSAAARLGEYAMLAQQRLDKGEPLSPTVSMAQGGVAVNTVLRANQDTQQAQQDPEAYYTQQQQNVNSITNRVQDLSQQMSNFPPGSTEYNQLQQLLIDNQSQLSYAQDNMSMAQSMLTQQVGAGERTLLSDAVTDPSSVIDAAAVGQVPEEGGYVDPNFGQVTGDITVDPATVDTTATATTPTGFDAAQMTPATVAGQVDQAVGDLQSAEGTVSTTVDAAQADPEAMAQLSLEASQMEAAQVNAVNPRSLEPGEVIDGSAVDMQAVEAASQIEAAQADPSRQATVQGQMESLMQDFEGGETPAWAAGAMRAATSAMNARGLGASSMAGQAIVQAAMEAAVPIAAADAQTFAAFEMQNLSNRQQVTMFAAEQRAKFLGQQFDQNFQTKVLNATKVSEIANLNFTAEQQVALENARLAQSANINNMNSRNAKMLSDAAAMSQMELTNLNNRQQAQVQNAQSFLQMDLANLSNAQQTSIFKTQTRVNALLSDQAAENAAQQFNAASENQVNQFFADLQASVSQFNAEQTNATNQFNAGEKNTARIFNATVQAERDQFNATNRLVVAQANAQWRQTTSLAEFTAQTESNMQQAQAVNSLTMQQLDNIWQRERDLMSFAFAGSESAADREVQLLLGNSQIALEQQALAAEEQAALGALAANILFGGGGGGLLGGLF